MKALSFAVILVVMQTGPPVPRQTPDSPTRAATNVHVQSKRSQALLLPSPATTQTNSNRPAESDSGKQGQQDAEHSVVISKLPAVALDAPKRDWADWGTWGFNGLLVAVGVFQVFLLFWTLRFIRKQTLEMRRQRVLMRKQWREMSQQTASLKEYVDETKKIAQSTVDTASIGARVAIPTLVIDKFESGDTGLADVRATLQFPKVKIVIKNYGQTLAFLRSWNIIFTCEQLPPVPDYWHQPGTGEEPIAAGFILEKDVVLPNEPYTLPEIPNWKRTEISIPDVDAILDRRKHLWVYGFICYYDLFGSPLRRMKFCEMALNFSAGWIGWISGCSPDAYLGTEDYIFSQSATAEEINAQAARAGAKGDGQPER
jgi:hypothetical protein